MKQPRRLSRWLLAVGACWLFAIGLGMWLLLNHEFGAGRAAWAPEHWPATSRIAADRRRPTLVMVAHPRCPCTRASVDELGRLMTRLGGRVNAHVLFVKPAGAPAGFTETDTWVSAARIPGVQVHVDDKGVEAGWFGVKTSGQVLLYGADGRLEFAGGITPTRGHRGVSVGFDRIVSLVTTGTTGWSSLSSAVFGCSLSEEDDS